MPWQIVWTKPALEELGEALAYIRSDNQDAAQAIYDETFRQLHLIATQPLLGTPIVILGKRLRSVVIHPNYRLLYKPH